MLSRKQAKSFAESEAVRVLVVGMGDPGGVGRYELLLVDALRELAQRGEIHLEAIWLNPHPAYLFDGVPPGAPSRGRFAGIQLTRKFLRSLALYRPDLVFFTHINVARLGVLAPRRFRYVVGTHGAEVWGELDGWRRRALRMAARVVSVGPYTAEKLISIHGVPKSKVTVLPLALERSWSRLDTPTERPQGLRLLSVSRLSKAARDKGIDTLIEALPQISIAVPETSLTVVGTGDDQKRLEEIARKRGVSSRIHFMGAIDHAQLLEQYRTCSIFVLPSLREGFGLVFLEAMAFARPVVAHASAGTLDVVAHEESGILVEGNDQLVEAVIRLAKDPEAARVMGEAGLRRVREHFAFPLYVDGLLAVTREVRTPRGP